MILADLEIDGEVRQVIMQAPKNGFFYVVDRATGKLISAEPFIPVNWASHIDLDTGRPVETPGARYEIEQKVIFPGAWGGHNWHPMTYSPDTGLVYIPIIGTSESFANPEEFEFFDNQLNTAIDWKTVSAVPEEEIAANPYVSARVSAWNPVTQREVFRIDSGSGWNAGLLSTAGNLIFQGEGSGEFAAYRADDGKTALVRPCRHRHPGSADKLCSRWRTVRRGRWRLGRESRLVRRRSRAESRAAGNRQGACVQAGTVTSRFLPRP